MTIHVVGNLCRDVTLTVRRFPRPGETLVATSSRTGLGGKGVNQAVAAARAGAPVVLYVAVGQEDVASLRGLLDVERGLRLDVTGLDSPTDTSILLVRPDGENTIVSATICAGAFDPMGTTGLGAALAAGDLLVMQGNLTAAATRACLDEGRRRSALTILNPSPLWDDAGLPSHAIDLLVVNAGELEALSREADPARGAERLLAEGVGAVVVTLGARGVIHLDRSGRIDIAAPRVAVLDTSGAGDVFCGVLAGSIARGVERGEALALATAAASLSVTRPGALASCPSAAELAALPLPTCVRSPR